MPDQLNPGPVSGSEQFEGPRELFEPFKKFQQIVGFWRTRTAILNGETLYDYDNAQLQEGRLGPWTFNLLQGTLSGLPALLIPFAAKLLRFTMAEETPDDKTMEILQWLRLPFILTVTAYVVGRASLWKTDATKTARARAARVFLSLDGAYGLYPQAAGCAGVTLYLMGPDIQALHSLLLWVGVWQLVVSMKTIPAELFYALGYYSPTGSLASGSTLTLFPVQRTTQTEVIVSRSEPPKWKYRLSVLFVVPAIAIIISVVLGLLAMGLHAVMPTVF